MIAVFTSFDAATSDPLADGPQGLSPMLRCGEHPVVVHDLRWLAEHGLKRVVIAHGEADGIADFVGDGKELGLEELSLIRPEHEGAAAALRAAGAAMDQGPVVVVDCRHLFDFDLKAMLEEHANSPAIATMAVHALPGRELPAWRGRRVETDRTGRVLRLLTPQQAPELELVSAGCAVLEPRLIQHVPEDQPFELERDLFGLILRKNGVLAAHQIHGRVFERNTPEAQAAAARN